MNTEQKKMKTQKNIYSPSFQNEESTIVALASAAGVSPRAIIRISGVQTSMIVSQCFRATSNMDSWRDSKQAIVVQGFFLWTAEDTFCRNVPAELFYWPDEHSYTGEQCAELHFFGSPFLIDAALASLCRAGARMAEPGEFTMRAFLHGQMDLVQAEAVLGTIDAASDRSLRNALAQLSGSLSQGLTQLRETVADIVARLEAEFDFADEPMNFTNDDELDRMLKTSEEVIQRLLEIAKQTSSGEHLIRIVLAGRPNAGKSMLYHHLTGGDVIVSSQAGTTRDYLTARLLNKKSFLDTNTFHADNREPDGSTLGCRKDAVLVDTAGIFEPATQTSEWSNRMESPNDHAEKMAHEQHQLADILILCLDGTTPEWHTEDIVAFGSARGYSSVSYSLSSDQQDGDENVQRDSLLTVFTKSDLLPSSQKEVMQSRMTRDEVMISTITHEGMSELYQKIERRVQKLRKQRAVKNGNMIPATATRCHEALQRALDALQQARIIKENQLGDELLAMELHHLLDAIGELVGAVYTEDLLERIFSKFCIGK